MAADTREDAIPNPNGSSESTTPPPKGTAHEPKALPVPPPNANALSAAAGLNTAGGRTKEASYFDALRSLKFVDFQEIHTKPCVRDAFLTGIGGGFGIGGVRAVLGAPVWKTCNWAVGSFVFGSLLMFEFCQSRRRSEKQGIKRAVEVIDRKRAEKKNKAGEARGAETKAKEKS